MNKVILKGRLTKDPDTRTLGGDNAGQMARFTLAVDRRYSKDGNKEADFIGCVAFGKTAEFISKYFGKGSEICIEGRIQTGSYTNKDGQKVYTTDVVVDNAEFCGSKSSGTSTAPAPQSQADPMNEGFMQVDDGLNDEGLPFF